MKTTKRICQSGGKKLGKRYVNEDIVRSGDGYSLLMDGATGLGEQESINGLTLAEWYVQEAANYMEILLQQDKSSNISELVIQLILYMTQKVKDYESAKNIQFKSHEEPSSSLVICREVKVDGKRKIQIFILRGL